MGATRVTVTIRNPAEPARSWDGLFLVDAGATDSVVPRACVEAIGLEPEGQRVYETADGRQVRLDFARAFIEFMGDLAAGRVVIVDNDAEPLLGVTALESAGIEVDPVSQRLKRLPALRLKHAASASTRLAPSASTNRSQGLSLRHRCLSAAPPPAASSRSAGTPR